MIVTLTGENDFARSSELKILVDKFIKEYGDLALEKIDGDETSFEYITEAITNLPFLASKKLVVFRNPSNSKDFLDKHEILVNNLPETTDLILVEPKLDKRTSLYKFLKKFSDFRDFTQLDFMGLSKWIVQTVNNSGGDISTSDARYLVDRAGENQQKLANELDKLITHNLKVTKKSIEELVSATPQSKIFALLDVAFTGNKQRVLKLYDEQRQQKIEPINIIGMLAWQLNILAIIKTAGDKPTRQIASEAKLNPYVVDKSKRLADQLSLSDIKRYITNLLQLDKQAKSSSIDTDEALRVYLLSIA